MDNMCRYKEVYLMQWQVGVYVSIYIMYICTYTHVQRRYVYTCTYVYMCAFQSGSAGATFD